MNLESLRATADRIRSEIGKAVHGQDRAVGLLLVSLFARGHSLIEGPPGTAKTLLAQSLAAALHLDFGRIQFTPDLMPGDVLGANIFDFSSNEFRLTKGPVFTEILLGDEINRAPPKTQAALLQAMQERVVTIDGTDYRLGRNFMVVATQNPIEHQGTYPLPEAQLDRFLFKLDITFPDGQAEFEILRRNAGQSLDHESRGAQVQPVISRTEIDEACWLVDNIRLDDTIIGYALALAQATRSDPDIQYGVSTRAADALCSAVRANAALEGRDYAIPDDVKVLFTPAMRHRIVLSPGADLEGRTPDEILANIIDQIEAPR
ncbi:MAG: MoxR family ATPase [Pseudomonadota bacterium]